MVVEIDRALPSFRAMILFSPRDGSFKCRSSNSGSNFARSVTFMQASDIFASGDNFQKQRHQVDVARAIFDVRDIGSVNHDENIRPLSSPPDKLVRECPPSLSGQTPSGRGDNLHVNRNPMIPINESGRNTHEVLKAFAQSIAKGRRKNNLAY